MEHTLSPWHDYVISVSFSVRTSVGIQCIDQDYPQLNPHRVGIILEGIAVMDDLVIQIQASVSSLD